MSQKVIQANCCAIDLSDPLNGWCWQLEFCSPLVQHYFLGTTSGNQLIAGENHAARLSMMPMTETTAGMSGRSARWGAWHGEPGMRDEH